MVKKLLIVEESLRDIEAHWFEYLKTITKGVESFGWVVDVVCNAYASNKVLQSFRSFPLFKVTRYLDTRKRSMIQRKMFGVIGHNIYTLRVLWAFMKQSATYDCVFVPTVLIHHLIAWYFIMLMHPKRPKHLVLFFVTPPGVWNAEKKIVDYPCSSFLLKVILKAYTKFVTSKQVTFTVNASNAKLQFEHLTGLPFNLMPHPVSFDNTLIFGSRNDVPDLRKMKRTNDGVVSFVSLGFARHEKGSDLLKAAIEKLLLEDVDFNGHFTLQWSEAFSLPDGNICEPGKVLENHKKITLIKTPISSQEYKHLLNNTDCVVLPYRNSSYYARASQAVTEAAFNGIPMIYSKGGWLEENIKKYGAGIGINDESVSELVDAIKQFATDFNRYSSQAHLAQTEAKKYLTPAHFSQLLIGFTLEASQKEYI